MTGRPRPAALLAACVLAVAAPPIALLAHRAFGIGWVPAGVRDALVVLLLAPWLEEWLFRQGLQERLHRFRRWGRRANLMASLAFVAAHAPFVGPQAALWLVPSLALGEIWQRRRSLRLNAAMHMWFNASLWWATA